MSKELMEIGGFITEGAEIVNHDNSLSGNGTVDSPLGVVPGYNETVLFNSAATTSANINLSEPFSSFEKVDVYWRSYTRYFIQTLDSQSTLSVGATFCDQSNPQITTLYYEGAPNNTTLTFNKCFHQQITAGSNSTRTPDNNIYIYKIIGINRKA